MLPIFSANAHIIMPYHLLLDSEGETKLGKLQIGTTRRGIGPCYADKAARLGIRMQDLLDEKILRQKIYAALEPKRQLLRPFAKDPSIDLHAMTEEYRTLGHRLEPYIADTQRIVWDALDRNGMVVFEGAQGTLLDIDHGTYPFVTSSNPVAGAACVGAGVGPKDIDEVWGIAKAYVTRVGAGPFPTELEGDLGDRIATRGHEVGTTTGRRRRVGWFDAVPLRYAVAVNSVSSIMVNKLDILSGIHPLRLCVAYEIDGRRVEAWPSSAEVLARATPVYETFDGWDGEIHDVRALADLPEAARRYLSAIEAEAGVPIVLVSVGPERTQTIERAWRPMRHRSGAPA